MNVTYGRGFESIPPVPQGTQGTQGTVVEAQPMRAKVEALQVALSQLPQYEPETRHYFHGGMYCREVWRAADVTVVGKVHKKEHFYLIVSGTVVITTDEGVQRITGPHLLESRPGTKRAVYSETPALSMTFHRTDATTLEAAERELVEDDPTAMYALGNRLKNQTNEVLQ